MYGAIRWTYSVMYGAIQWTYSVMYGAIRWTYSVMYGAIRWTYSVMYGAIRWTYSVMYGAIQWTYSVMYGAIYGEHILTQWFLTFNGGTEPWKIHQCILRTLPLIGKIKYDFFKTQVYISLVHKMNHALVAHKITVFKENPPTKHEFLKKRVLWKIFLEFLMSAEPLRLTQRTPGVRSNPGYKPLL